MTGLAAGPWIFGGDPLVLDFPRRLVPLRRYRRWTFQGIADSVRDGLDAGAAHRLR